MPEETATGWVRAFRQGVVVEATNPKTAAFFLAFIPQFISVGAGHVALQFLVLGVISVLLNTGADLVAVMGAAKLHERLLHRPVIVPAAAPGIGIADGVLGHRPACGAARVMMRPGPARISRGLIVPLIISAPASAAENAGAWRVIQSNEFRQGFVAGIASYLLNQPKAAHAALRGLCRMPGGTHRPARCWTWSMPIWSVIPRPRLIHLTWR